MPPKIAAPKGTRDLYPEDFLRQRYITTVWRDTAVRHGFEEINGPTFETTELYSVKSGEGILSELFQAFSGKAPEELEQVRTSGQAPYAMRPEFTPTLARMYAAKAGGLPKPCKWFSIGPYFRAERPQRGRLREFLQWNCDVIGLGGEENAERAKAAMDAETVGLCIESLRGCGLSCADARVNFNSRGAIEQILSNFGLTPANLEAAVMLFDRRQKVDTVAFEKAANLLGIDVARYDDACRFVTDVIRPVVPGIPVAIRDHEELQVLGHGRYVNPVDLSLLAALLSGHDERPHSFNTAGIVQRWAELDLSIVRGLAYYTGLVFEAIADGERAVAGGGRYDKLIELMGGPPTPAVGFGMGDVVLSLLLDDKGLMPAGPDLLDACSRPSASLRPQAFVIAANPEHDAAMTRLLADLRRGPQDEKSGELRPWQRPAGLHARRSYKSTRNVGKLLDDARKQHALVAVMLDAEASDAAAPSAKLEHLVTRQTKEKVPFERINAEVRSMLGA